LCACTRNFPHHIPFWRTSAPELRDTLAGALLAFEAAEVSIMNTTLESAREAVSDRIAPALESLERNVRDARRTIAQGRRATEDLVDETTLRVRRRPFASVAVAASAGAIVGAMIGFALGWQVARPTPDSL
jgi:ElaB/YqjD/DUF883 family membrane-anchored ribosome-binding protein